MSSLVRTLSSPFSSKAVQGARKFMSLQASNAQKALTSEFQELFKERTVTRKRRKIVNEIIESEKTYQNHVSLLISLYLVPIKIGSILPRRAIEDIFGNIEAIHSVNVQLLELMETEDVATALYKLAPFMKLYSLYANNFELSNKTIEECLKKCPEFAAFNELQESREEMEGLKLRALLITPIQRIPRYKLLLESLLEKTLPDHADYQKLRDACAEISKVATHINECLRQHENFNRMLVIQNSFIGDGAPKILAPGRKFIREGVLSKVCDRGGSKERTFFLFNDMLIYARKETAGSYTCRGVFPLINCMVEQVMGGTRGPSDGGALFKISCKGKTLLLYSTSQHNARSWQRDIKDAIIELHNNLASLRRGENDPFTPPDAALRRDSKLRRSKGVKELSKRKNPLSPMQVLSACTSPHQDSLYPMRNEILPNLANNANQDSFLLQKNEPTIFTACMSSARCEKNPKPTLRRLQMEDSLIAAARKGKEGYSLRSRKRKLGGNKMGSDDVFVDTVDGETVKRMDKRNSQRRLIDDMVANEKDDAAIGCFGSSAKQCRKSDEYSSQAQNSIVKRLKLEPASEEQGSFVNMAVDNNEENEEQHTEHHEEAEICNGFFDEENVLSKNSELDDVASEKCSVDTKVWSLVDDANANGKQRKSFHGKSKVSRSRRKKRRISNRRPYQTSKSKSDCDNHEMNGDANGGMEGTFKYKTSSIASQVPQPRFSNEDKSSCVVM